MRWIFRHPKYMLGEITTILSSNFFLNYRPRYDSDKQVRICRIYSETLDSVILLPAHPASFAHNFVNGMQIFFISASPRMQ